MGAMLITILGFLGIIGNLPGIDSCKFGENCDYPCHCQNNDVCDPLDGTCPAGCDDGELRDPGDYWYTGAWSGYGCQIGNVAYDKTATQGPRTSLNQNAVNAIDGSHDPRVGFGRCAYAEGGSRTNQAWWQVDMGDTYVVISVNITNRDSHQHRLAYTDITIGSEGDDVSSFQLCTRIQGEGEADTVHVFCNSPRIGRFVRLQRHENARDSSIFTLCEVQVYGYLFYDCPDGYFGVACGNQCNCRDLCSTINGVCSTQNCYEGWSGVDCQIACPSGTWGDNCQGRCNCADSKEICNHVDGSCTCETGYGGVGCRFACPSGTWGDNCQERCNCADRLEVCNNVNGSCRCETGYGGVDCTLELPGLHSILELSSASLNTLTIRFRTWSPQNGGGSEPNGYRVEMRFKNDGESWTSGPEIEHIPMVIAYTVLLDNLEPHTYYYVRVIPFIEEGGLAYYGTPTQKSGPFLTTNEVEQESRSPTSLIVGMVVACGIGAALIIALVILFRRYRDQKRINELRDRDVVIPTVNGTTGNDEGLTSITPGTDHVYESIEEEDAVSPVHSEHMYENQTPSGRPLPINGQESANGFIGEFTQNEPSDPTTPAEGEYERMAPTAQNVDTGYHAMRGESAVSSGASNHVYEN